MLVPLSWLRRYLHIELPTEALADRLSASGSSVDRVLHLGQGLDDIIVGQAVEVSQHPNADRLKLAKVTTGSQQFDVVCGANNLEAGQHIAFAPVGAQIPVNMHDEGRRPFTLQAASIRGVVSQGMICSVAELGLGEDHDGILVLPDDTPLGQSLTQALDFPQTVLDVEVTTNRPDQLSMIGMAREVSVITNQPLSMPQPAEYTSDNNLVVTSEIDSTDCYRLMTQTLAVTVKPSPWWLQQLLTLAGMRPINNVVDVTNFVMLEYGQPMHAYDVSKLNGDRLIARQAQSGEQITTLDGVNRQLKPTMLVIADQRQPVGIAGIMGGEASRVEGSTAQIVLEAAVFDPVSIRRCANELALRSEASRRFERGVDRQMTDQALARAVELLMEVADAKVLSQPVDDYPQPLEARRVGLTARKLAQYLGTDLPLDGAETILNALGFATTMKDTEVLEVSVPSWRMQDVSLEVDLIEEVVRIFGYPQLPVSLPDGPLPRQPINRVYRQIEATRDRLARSGWQEIVTTSLISRQQQQSIGRDTNLVTLANPLSSEWTHLRDSLLPGLLEAAQRFQRQHQRAQMFEISAVYTMQPSGLPQEQTTLAMLMSAGDQPERNLAEMKGLIESVLSRYGLDQFQYQASQPPGPFDANNSIAIQVDGHQIGYVGTIQPGVQQDLDLPTTLIAEVNLDPFKGTWQHAPFQPLPKFPAVEEDLSLLAADDQPLGELVDIIRQAGGDMVESVDYVETYRGKELGADLKSPLFHLTFRAADRTLSSAELAEVRSTIISALKREGIQVRIEVKEVHDAHHGHRADEIKLNDPK